MGKKQAAVGTTIAPAVAGMPTEFVQIYAPTQGDTVGTPVRLLAITRLLPSGTGGGVRTVEVYQSTPATLGTPTAVAGVSFAYPMIEASINLSPGLNVLEARVLVNGAVVATDQVVVTLIPGAMSPPPPTQG